MIYLAEILLVGPVTLLTAWWHAKLIKENRPIFHGWWALLYAALVAGAIGWQWPVLLSVGRAGLFALACSVGRLVVFNISLNRFRGLSWTYVSKTSTSIADQVEIRLFGSRVWLFEVILVVVFMVLNLFL